MKRFIATLAGVIVLPLVPVAVALAQQCPRDSVEVGPICVDKYEASGWETNDRGTINKIKRGRIRATKDLARTAKRRGDNVDDYGAAGCTNIGSGCTRVYALSIPFVRPSVNITWFQAAAACRNAGKRLLTNAEWQATALGTPDPGQDGDGKVNCNTAAGVRTPTGDAKGCVSDVGAFDMVGNVWEWVADWIQDSEGSDVGSRSSIGQDGIFGINDAYPPQTRLPVALIRGGDFVAGRSAGIFALGATVGPSFMHDRIGFRCGR